MVAHSTDRLKMATDAGRSTPRSPGADHPPAHRPAVEELEYAVFEYIDWSNHRRLHGRIGMRNSAKPRRTTTLKPRF
jgi:transposase InsO family protein